MYSAKLFSLNLRVFIFLSHHLFLKDKNVGSVLSFYSLKEIYVVYKQNKAS